MAGNLKIRALGNWSLGITAVLAILCIAMSILGFRKYEVLQSSTRDYRLGHADPSGAAGRRHR